MRLNGKVVLVTGAAGQLGRSFCSALAKEGARVWLADIDLAGCEKVCKGLKNISYHRCLYLDVADLTSVRKAFQEILEKSKRLDALINNAGIALFSPFWERSFNDFMNVFKVNAGGTFLCMREASKIMMRNESGGSIVNIASIYGMVSGDPRIYTDCQRNTSECYGASKAAVIQLTKYFAAHLAKYNIRVNSVSPGGVFNNQGKDFVANYSYRAPMARMADKDELSGAVLFLISRESSYMTGHNLVVDGGFTAW